MSSERGELDVRATREPHGTVVHLQGEIDLRTAPQLRRVFLELVDERPARIILNLAGVGYIDSSGVGTIVELKRLAMRSDGAVVLVGLQPRVRSLFEVTRLDNFFTIVERMDEARQA
jgi:anti-sigma B factor antagonist